MLMTDKEQIEQYYNEWILSKDEYDHLMNGIEIINNK